jgi:hypothetical protein
MPGAGRGFNPQGQGQQGQGQKRAVSPPPAAATNNLGGGSPPDAKRPRPNDPGPGVLVDSRTGPDGRPTSSKGGAPFQGMQQGNPGMNGQASNPQQQQRLQVSTSTHVDQRCFNLHTGRTAILYGNARGDIETRWPPSAAVWEERVSS